MIILIFILFAAPLFSQEYNFIKYDVKDGLSISQISQLETYSDGSLIIGTYGAGMNVYDGQTFHQLNTTNGFCNNNIYSLIKINDSLLWIGTEKGLIKLKNNKPQNFFIQDGLPSDLVWSLANGKNDVLWIGTNKGLAKYENGKIITIKNKLVSNQNIRALFTDSKGSLWIGLEDGLVHYNYSADNFIKKAGFSEIVAIHAFAEDSTGTIWIGTDYGLFKVNGNKYKKYGLKNGLTNDLIWSLRVDSNNDLWLGTEKGVTLFSNDKFIEFGAKEGLTDYRIWSIKEDLENNLWIASDEGLYKLSDKSFRIYKELNGKPIDAWTILEKDKNEYWIGSEIQGMVILKDGKLSEFNIDNFKFHGLSRLFLDNDKNIWIGTSRGIYKYSEPAKKITLMYDKLNDPVTDIIQDEKGILYFSTYGDGIINYDGKDFNKEDSELIIYYSFIDSHNRFWIATSSGLELRTDGSTFVPNGFEWTRNYTILNVLEDQNGWIWAGSYEGGLFGFDGNNINSPEFDTVSVKHGLNNESILGTTLDADNNIWISTNSGFNKFDLNEYHKTGIKKIISYDLNDGIPGVEAFEGGILTDSQNNIFISTIDGLVVFDPKTVEENNRAPVTKITKVRILDREFNEKYISEEELINSNGNSIELSYNQNNLTIQFVGISLTNPKRVQYSYKLNSGKWSAPSPEAKAYLPNLPYGNYRFQVKASNNHGVWSKSPATLTFEITAPLWKKLWFQILAILTIFSAIYFFYLIRLRRANRINKELEERIEERIRYEAELLKSEKELKLAKEAAEKSDRLKSEFLAQMSHEIRTPINSILSFSGILKDELKDKVDGTLKEGFSIIESGGRRLIRTIDSVLNMSQLHTGNLELNKKEVDLCEIFNDLYLELKNFAENKHIKLEIVCEEKECLVFADQYTITQLFANLIDNAIKYTKRGKVTVKLKSHERGKAVVEIIDTGIGMSEEFQKQLFKPFMQEDQGYSRKFEGTGLGLSLVEKYAELNNAKVSFTSKKNVGTTFVVEIGCK